MPDPLPRLTAALSDRYTIEREIGRGGMATVYLAEDLKHKRKVAIKVLKPELAAALGGDRFLREIETTAGLHHPNILPLYDSGEAGKQESGEGLFLYYVMPLVEGESLRDRLDREKQLPIEDALQITREVADALRYAHSRGIIHRDIKPENILLEGGHAMVADFGIAKAVTAAGGETLTQTGMAVGTPHYMSPEQSAGESDLDGRSDLYALGSVLYEMLAGEPPYTGPSAQAIIAKRLMEPVPRISVVRETVPPHVEHALTRVMAKAPADRYPTADEFIAALQDTTASGSTVTIPTAPRGGLSAALRRGLVAAAVVIAVVASYFFLRNAAPGGPLSPDLIAVLPFTVRGNPELDYLGEGMVDLMSAKLDGADPLSAVNPRVVISLVSTMQIDIADPVAVQRAAVQLHAGRYVTGEILEAGGRLQLIAYLHDTDRPDAAPVRATAEGRPDQLFEVIDGLAVDLLSSTMSGASDRIKKVATATSASLPATKEFLQGERLLRVGAYREAAEAYDRAVALDTAFALAWYRKSVAADWIDGLDVRSSADRAWSYADRFSPRDRQLVSALRHRRHGENHLAAQEYAAQLHTWPDEVEGQVQMGEILFHDNPRLGQPMAEAIPVFESALALENSNANARIHLARLYALYGNIDSLRETVRHFTAENAESERTFEVQAILAWTVGDTALQADILRRIGDFPAYYRFYAVLSVARFARNTPGARLLLNGYEGSEPWLVVGIPNLLVAQGKIDSLRRFFRSIPGGRTPNWDMYEAFLWTSGTVPADTLRMEGLLTAIRAADPAEIQGTRWLPPYDDLTPAFAAFERNYHTALLMVHLDRPDEARRVIALMNRADSFPGLGQTKREAIKTLEAELAYRAGNADQALNFLRSVEYEVPHAATVLPMIDGARGRFLRAELELATGDTATAMGFYHGLDDSWSPWDTPFRPLVYERLGAIAEAQGRKAEAIDYYSRLIDLYRDADPIYAAERETILQRRNALLGPR